jgi:hypothetical protein
LADGIRINDASVEITPAALDAMVKKQGAQVTVTGLDLSISPEALNTLLSALAPAGQPAPSAAVSDGRVQLTTQAGGQNVAIDVRAPSFRIEITAEGLRIVNG